MTDDKILQWYCYTKQSTYWKGEDYGQIKIKALFTALLPHYSPHTYRNVTISENVVFC